MLIALLASLLAAPALPELAPGARYDARIPTLKQVVGARHRRGHLDTRTDHVLPRGPGQGGAGADAPLRVRRTWEGRPLARAGHGRRRADGSSRRGQGGPRQAGRPARPVGGRGGQARRASCRPSTWLVHGVHGNEISSCDAALALAYHLLAAQGDPEVEADPPRVHRPHRSQREPGRARAIPGFVPIRPGRGAGRRAGVARARRALAGRPRQPLPLRHEPRLVRPLPAGDPGPGAGVPRVVSRRWWRTSTRWAATRPTSSPRPREPLNPQLTPAQKGWLGGDRQGHRGPVRCARVRLLRPRGLRLLLPRLRRELAALPRARSG